MVEIASPLGDTYHAQTNAATSGKALVELSECPWTTILEVTAWPGQEDRLREVLSKALNLRLEAMPGSGAVTKTSRAFNIGPNHYLLASSDAKAVARFMDAFSREMGSWTDVSHGRTCLAIKGDASGWVLAKLFALDFAGASFPLFSGCSTAHHETFAQIQRSTEERFELYVFRSFARSFWLSLCEAARETGYKVK